MEFLGILVVIAIIGFAVFRKRKSNLTKKETTDAKDPVVREEAAVAVSTDQVKSGPAAKTKRNHNKKVK